MKTMTRSARLNLKTKTNTLLGAVLFLLVISAASPSSSASGTSSKPRADRPSNYWQVVYVAEEAPSDETTPETKETFVYGRTFNEAVAAFEAGEPAAIIRCIARESYYLCSQRGPSW